jgi:hypothetical protein
MIVQWENEGVGEFNDMDAFRIEHPTATIVRVNDKLFHGECAKCGRVISGSDRYGEYEAEVLICEDCCNA